MKTSRLTKKYQITLPVEVRKQLGLKAGDLVVIALEGGRAVLTPIHGSFTDHLTGLGKEVWKALGGGEQFLKGEREAWR